MKTPSIRRSLLFRCGIGVGTLLCLLSATTYLLVRHRLYREMDQSITQTAALLANQVELENGTITFEWQEGLGSNDALNMEGLFQFWDDHTNATTRSPALKSNDLPRFHSDNGSPLVKSIVLPNGNQGRAVGLRVYPFVLPEEAERMQGRGQVIDPKGLPHTLVVACDVESAKYTLDQLRFVLATGTLLILLIGFTLIDHVIHISLRPIDDLTRQIEQLSEHQLDSFLTVPGSMPVELTGLAKHFDFLLARVAAIRKRERDFIRHAAHELRTPIAGLRATTDLALSQPREAAEYARHLTVCQKSAVDLGELVQRLSMLSRIGQTGSVQVREKIDIKILLAECLKPFQKLFAERGLGVKYDEPRGRMFAIGDVVLVRMILNNLLDNALSYASAGSEIRIWCSASNNWLEIGIANRTDDPPDDLERLFEPLFRMDSSRSDQGTHLGIGLTLSVEAAGAMGGRLHATRAHGEWIEFTFGIPTVRDEIPPAGPTGGPGP